MLSMNTHPTPDPASEPIRSKKQRIFDIIQLGTQYDLPSQLFDYLMISMISLNLAILLIDTFDAAVPFRPLYKPIEYATVVFF
ncbi:MAG: hypothetical protein IJ679_08180, partial [Lachnospiraceae bacterium]|nr:hypothetical protein [Lachnospiraceae bacterium]